MQPDDNTSNCDGKELFALQVLGDDMEEEFPDKCIIIIQHFDGKVPNSYVFVEVDGEKWFRQYKVEPNGREYLHACNESYPDIELNNVDWKVLGLIHQRNIRRKIKTYTYSNE
ncbi:MAG: S24 family peptidase [Gammaproteobacteria bacterium]|nr:MAG: S24 family peptidase [Gammaproteobacteria bacterium]